MSPPNNSTSTLLSYELIQTIGYRPPDLKSTAHNPSQIFTEYHVFRMLDTLNPTAIGLDGLPAWFLQLAVPALSEPLTRLFNLSLESSVVPSQWKSSYITPKPKLNQPHTPQDYRPISITPILSRIMEKSLVRSNWHSNHYSTL